RGVAAVIFRVKRGITDGSHRIDLELKFICTKYSLQSLNIFINKSYSILAVIFKFQWGLF
ncbi:MAG TPA: hypothetical protein DCY71_10390, partial [Clostridiaceae bacterium]|nr:hypothetical protein [Clostridiaceae bacterium]